MMQEGWRSLSGQDVLLPPGIRLIKVLLGEWAFALKMSLSVFQNGYYSPAAVRDKRDSPSDFPLGNLVGILDIMSINVFPFPKSVPLRSSLSSSSTHSASRSLLTVLFESSYQLMAFFS